MRAVQKRRPKVFLRTNEFKALVRANGLDTIDAQAVQLGTDSGNLSRILRGQPVSAEFIARVRLTYPNVPYDRLFREAMA